MAGKISLKPKKTSPVKKAVSSIKEGIENRKENKMVIVTPEMLIPSPSTALNLRCTGTPHGCFVMGTVANLIGDSHAGKSIFGLGVLAECSIDPRFDNYDLILNDTENACAFDIKKMFGSKLDDRLEVINTKHHEQFESDIKKRLDAGKKLIYIVDSFDGMTTYAAEALRIENIKREEKGLDKKESYGDGKAKLFSQFGSSLTDGLSATNSFCLVISQTRDNIGFGAQFTPKKRSGGHALKFYSFHEIWIACMQQEKHSKYKDEIVRVAIEARISKNKAIGRKGIAHFDILHGYGVDDVKSCIDLLLHLGHWTGTAGKIDTKGFYPLSKEISRVKLIELVETKNKETALQIECKKAYDKLMSELEPQRKTRY